jgi:hypothetical protein
VRPGNTGFREENFDGDDHPSRHFAAFVVMGYDHGLQNASIFPGIHEIGSGDSHNVKDWNLGILGAMLGDGLARGNIKKEDVGNWILEHL